MMSSKYTLVHSQTSDNQIDVCQGNRILGSSKDKYRLAYIVQTDGTCITTYKIPVRKCTSIASAKLGRFFHKTIGKVKFTNQQFPTTTIRRQKDEKGWSFIDSDNTEYTWRLESGMEREAWRLCNGENESDLAWFVPSTFRRPIIGKIRVGLGVDSDQVLSLVLITCALLARDMGDTPSGLAFLTKENDINN